MNPHLSLLTGFAVLLVCAVPRIATAAPSSAEAPLAITDISFSNTGTLTLWFESPDPELETFFLEYSPDLGANADWVRDDTAVILPLGQGNWRVDTEKPAADSMFYRIAGVAESGPALVQFDETTVAGTAGETIEVPIGFAQPFTGTLTYRIDDPALGGEPVTGEIVLAGETAASIPVPATDDGDPSARAITVEVTPDESEAYRTTARNFATVMVKGRTSEWSGTFTYEGATIGFALETAAGTGNVSANFISTGEGIFPEGTFPAAVTSGASAFAAEVSGVPLPADESLVGDSVTLDLSLEAVAGEPGNEVSPDLKKGTGRLTLSSAENPHLDFAAEGAFVLMEAPMRPSTREIVLTDAP